MHKLAGVRRRLKNLLDQLSISAGTRRNAHVGCTQVVPKNRKLVMELTDKEVAKLALRKGESERLIADDALPGLRLRLRRGRKGTSRKWIYKYRDPAGVQRIFTRDCAGVSVTAARKWAGTLQAARRVGRDPAQERDAGRVQSAETFGATLRSYLPSKAASVRPSTLKELERHLLTYLRPLHRLPLASISTATLTSRLNDDCGGERRDHQRQCPAQCARVPRLGHAPRLD